jgi:chromate transporter
MVNYLALYLDICWGFGKIGILSFGGGNAMLKMIEFEAVSERSWITSDEFAQITGASFLFPGLTAVKISTIIGFKIAGSLGALLAFLSLNIPGILLAVAGFHTLKYYEGNAGVEKLITLVQYGALALLIASVYAIGKPVLKENFSVIYLLGAIVLLIGLIYYDFSPFWALILYISIFYFIY